MPVRPCSWRLVLGVNDLHPRSASSFSSVFHQFHQATACGDHALHREGAMVTPSLAGTCTWHQGGGAIFIPCSNSPPAGVLACIHPHFAKTHHPKCNERKTTGATASDLEFSGLLPHSCWLCSRNVTCFLFSAENQLQRRGGY